MDKILIALIGDIASVIVYCRDEESRTKLAAAIADACAQMREHG